MVNVKTVSDYINSFAPYNSQCEWDNSGVLVGDIKAQVKKVGICLDLTEETFAEASNEGVDLIITHHPLIFTAQKKFLADDISFRLAKEGINLISVHTPFDCAVGGVNDILCEILEIKDAVGIESDEVEAPMARIGCIEEKESSDFACIVAEKLGTVCRVVNCGNKVKKVAVCGGAGFDFFFDAVKLGADAYVTGDVKHHEMLLAKDKGVTLIDAGHFHTENPAMTVLKDMLMKQFNEIEFVLLKQSDPFEFIG